MIKAAKVIHPGDLKGVWYEVICDDPEAVGEHNELLYDEETNEQLLVDRHFISMEFED